jgi:hypothetical protein
MQCQQESQSYKMPQRPQFNMQQARQSSQHGPSDDATPPANESSPRNFTTFYHHSQDLTSHSVSLPGPLHLRINLLNSPWTAAGATTTMWANHQSNAIILPIRESHRENVAITENLPLKSVAYETNPGSVFLEVYSQRNHCQIHRRFAVGH